MFSFQVGSIFVFQRAVCFIKHENQLEPENPGVGKGNTSI